METRKLTCVGEFGLLNSTMHTNRTPVSKTLSPQENGFRRTIHTITRIEKQKFHEPSVSYSSITSRYDITNQVRFNSHETVVNSLNFPCT